LLIEGTARHAEDARAEKLLGILRSHGVTATLLGVQQGPVVTVYMVTVPTSMKNSRVIGLADEIRRVMELPEGLSCRIAVIAGRDAIGIELPTTPRQTVKLSTVMESAAFRDPKLVLPLALGVTIDGKPVAADLARMPHLLIAGTTGSGKSVLMNAMIMSLIKTLGPDECKFILIDPKKLELTPYDGIPHLLTPVVTSVKEAVRALKWAVEEMDNRYTVISKARVRNIEAYNNKARSGDVAGQALPRIVIVIDEAAKLMRMAKDDVEFVVERLAAEARAAGIHLIMATQHPIVEIITTTIKANFPSRVALNVTNKRASGVILGEGMEEDASKLQGSGDMFVSLGEATPMRVHGAFVSDDEVTVETERLRAQGEPDYVVVGESDIKEEDAAVFDGTGMGERERETVGTDATKIQTAMRFLYRRLDGDANGVASTALIAEAANETPPIAQRTLYRAAERIGVEVIGGGGKCTDAGIWRMR
jgi:S-DNA-T family DNA segregation ATPase FtsK/SpoIIIE